MALGWRPAVAQTEEFFGHAIPARIHPEPNRPVWLLGIEAIDAESRDDADESVPLLVDPAMPPSKEGAHSGTVGQANCGTRSGTPAVDELHRLSADAPSGAVRSVLGHFDDSYADSLDEPLNFRDDFHNCLPVLRDDAVGVVNWNNAAILGGALGAAIGMRQGLDDDVRKCTARHPERWGDLSKALGRLGEPQYQLPVWLGVYAYSLHRQDEELHAMTGSLLSAYTISSLTTISIKAIANTDRPSKDWNDGQFGFPSFHTSSSFSIASVLDEYYGPKVGLPAYAVAGLIGWSRIDERDHDLSDVVFGAALGFVIGKAVARRHLYGDSRVRLLPYVHPTDGTSGLMFEIPY